MGPQHPSTHGVLRLLLELEGEKVLKCTPCLGYLHRGLEKAAQSRLFSQYLPMVDRVDYLSGFFCSHAYLSALEELSEIELPKKARYIRVLTMELNRISSHLLWFGTFLLDLGATGPVFFAFNLRNERYRSTHPAQRWSQLRTTVYISHLLLRPLGIRQ